MDWVIYILAFFGLVLGVIFILYLISLTRGTKGKRHGEKEDERKFEWPKLAWLNFTIGLWALCLLCIAVGVALIFLGSEAARGVGMWLILGTILLLLIWWIFLRITTKGVAKDLATHDKTESHSAEHGHGGGWKFPSFTFGNVFWAVFCTAVLLLVLSPSLRDLTVSKISYMVDGPPPTTSYASRQCAGVELPLYLTSGEWTKLNPWHRCRILYYKDRGEVIADESGTFARARDGVIKGIYSLCPIELTGDLNFDCSPI